MRARDVRLVLDGKLCVDRAPMAHITHFNDPNSVLNVIDNAIAPYPDPPEVFNFTLKLFGTGRSRLVAQFFNCPRDLTNHWFR